MEENIVSSNVTSEQNKVNEREFVTMEISGQLFGISVNSVRDVLVPQKITKIPLAPPEVIGSLNLRGRIVTAIDVRVILGLPKNTDYTKAMSIVIEHKEELYSLAVDVVGDVLSLPLQKIITNPENLSSKWQDFSIGIYPLQDRLLVMLDVEKLIRD